MTRNAFALTLLAAALILTVTIGIDSRQAALGDDPPGASIGYVDVTKVYNGYNKVIDRKKEIEDLYNGTIDRLKKEQEALDKEKEVLELMNRESSAYLEKVKSFQERQYKVRYELQLTQREFSLDVDQLTKETYQEILRELEAYTRRHNYQLVLKIDSEVEIDDDKVDPMQYVANRQILYYSSSRDITQPLLEALNRNYIRKPSSGSGDGK